MTEKERADWRANSLFEKMMNPTDELLTKQRKYNTANRTQSAADQFFQLAGAAQELTKLTANG